MKMYVCMYVCMCIIIPRWVSLRMRNVSDKFFAEETTAQISSSMNFFPKSVPFTRTCIVALPLQKKRLREHATMLLYTCMSYLVLPSRLLLDLQSDFFPSVSPNKSLYTPPYAATRPNTFLSPFLESLQGMFFPSCNRQSFTRTQNNKKPHTYVFTPYVTSTQRVLYPSNPESRWGLPH